MYEIRRYITRNGADHVQNWLRQQRDVRVRLAFQRRMTRIEMGDLGDHKFCREGVWEVRIDVGPGYRIYYSLEDSEILLLLCAGDKDSQASDIRRATEFLLDWKERQHER